MKWKILDLSQSNYYDSIVLQLLLFLESVSAKVGL